MRHLEQNAPQKYQGDGVHMNDYITTNNRACYGNNGCPSAQTLSLKEEGL